MISSRRGHVEVARTEDHTLLEDEGAGYLISVSDMMSGLLFIFIITLMAFVMNLQEARQSAQKQQKELEQTVADLTNADEIRAELLEKIRAELDSRGIQVRIDQEQGVLRLQENAIRFPSGRALLRASERSKIEIIARVLAAVLPCYAEVSELPMDSCQPRTLGKLESVFIEGHTDNVPIGSSSDFESNWELSAQRAIESYRVLQSASPELVELRNGQGQRLFSVSGYGEERPVVAHASPTADPMNRRIDLRFIMVAPEGRDPEILQELDRQGVR